MEWAVVIQGLLAAGRVEKVALAACRRKLLIILSRMMRSGRHWDPQTGTHRYIVIHKTVHFTT